MRAIMEYVVNMLPYMLLALLVYVPLRAVVCKRRRGKIKLCRELALLFFTLFAVGLASQTVIPKFEFGVGGFHILRSGKHETNLIPGKVLADTWQEAVINGNGRYFVIFFLGNILMFVPLGFFPRLLWEISEGRAIAVGVCSSVLIELIQLFLPRQTDIDDVILNTLGIVIGVLLYRLLRRKRRSFTVKFRVGGPP